VEYRGMGDSIMISRFIMQRIYQCIIVLVFISAISFTVINLAPGDPALALYGGEAQQLTPAERAKINHNFGMDRPIWERYFRWFFQVVHGNLGVSYREGRRVTTILKERIPNTLILFSASMLLIIITAITLGLKGGLSPGSGWDRGLSAASVIFTSIPAFWFGILCVMFFSVYLQILPSSGIESLRDGGGYFDRLKHLILPALVMASTHAGLYARFIQEEVKEEINSYYVLIAKANGLAGKYLRQGILKNALIPFINYLGVTIPGFFGGSIIIESLFSWPGLGQINVKATMTRDYPLLMGSILLSGILVVICILLADIALLILNPKLRRQVHG
jgi:peptide/nickel transport system permease protein